MYSIDSLWDVFSQRHSNFGKKPVYGANILVPYLPGEFNRCAEHTKLNAMLLHPDAESHRGWFKRALVCRSFDQELVTTGWYSTLFEMFVAASTFSLADQKTVSGQLCRDVIETLGIIGIEKS